MINILLLGAGNRVSLCEYLIEAGKTYNEKVKIFSLELEDCVPVMKCATIIKGCGWTDPLFESKLTKTTSEFDIHLIVPLMDGATVSISKIKNKLYNRWVVVSDYELCKIFNDKELSNAWFKKKGIRVPPRNEFPIILKKKDGFGSRDQFILQSQEEYQYILNKINIKDYFQQSFVKGEEFSVDAYVSRNGSLLGAVTRLRLSVINGEVSRGLTKRNEELLSIVNQIVVGEKFEGPITIQAINSNHGWYVIEINPRFGGGVIQSFKAGANYAEALIAEYLGQPLPNLDQWEENLLMMRCNREIWQHEYHN